MNPFTPTFGSSPPLLVGRDGDLVDFREGLLDGPGAPERATLVTGVRGAGKTVMLNAYEDLAGAEGWVVVPETATPGLVERLAREHLPALLREHDPEQTESRLTGVSLPGGLGAEREVDPLHVPRPGFRDQLSRLATVMAARGSGVLLTVDEVHREVRDDLREIATTVQHAFRERLAVAFVGAGLPAAVEDLLNDDVLTFLRRADRRHLRALDSADVERALADPLRASGRQIERDALEIAVGGAAGYPFMTQLIGLHLWRESVDEATIDVGAAERAVARARVKMAHLVHDTALADLSAVDRSFLVAMSVDDGPSRTSDVARRLGVTVDYAGQYRRRLIAAEVITPTTHGFVDFVLPGLREHLRSRQQDSP